MVTPDQIYQEAKDIFSSLQHDRETLHKSPEVGSCLPNTKKYVMNRLTQMGYNPKEICESGIVAEISGNGGNGGKCLLLRADMDALKVEEKTDLPFKSQNGCMHACGHDFHTAMLLGAAELLMKHKNEINGTVKLVFQPDEEGFTGAKTMLKAGVLSSPVPQAGLALHIHSGTPTGLLLCGKGTTMAGCTLFRIKINGVGCHGAMPETGVDPVNIAAHILIALQEINSREISAKTPAVITVGKMSAGKAPNIIPQDAVIEGTIRTFDRQLSANILARIGEISSAVAAAFRGSADTTEISSAPPLVNNPELMDEMAGYVRELFGEKAAFIMNEGGMGSEDFASYTYEIPCAYMLLGAGSPQENPAYGKPMHNESVVFNEQILPMGAAVHTYCAIRYLSK